MVNIEEIVNGFEFYLKTQKDNTNGDIIQPTEALTFPDGNGQPLYPNLTQ